MSKFTPYRPSFVETSKKTATSSLKEAKKLIKKLKEEEADPKDIEKIIDAIDEVVTDAIEDLGAGSPVVGDLIDAAKDLDMHYGIASGEEEIIMTEEEEDSEEDDEELEEAEEDDSEKEDDDEEEEMKEEESEDELEEVFITRSLFVDRFTEGVKFDRALLDESDMLPDIVFTFKSELVSPD